MSAPHRVLQQFVARLRLVGVTVHYYDLADKIGGPHGFIRVNHDGLLQTYARRFLNGTATTGIRPMGPAFAVDNLAAGAYAAAEIGLVAKPNDLRGWWEVRFADGQADSVADILEP